MKKLLMLLAVTMLLFGVSGRASAYFEDGNLIRAVYQQGGQYEVLTDLGPFSPTAPYSGANLSFTSNPFPSAGSGVFSSATWAKLQVAYFIKTENAVWTSGPLAGQTSGSHKFDSFGSAANSVYAGAGNNASGTPQAMFKQTDQQSYVTNMDLGDTTVTAGFFASFIPARNGEQNLAALGSGSAYVDSYLYYYANANSAAPGLQVADIRTYADGHTEIASVISNPVATHFAVAAAASAISGAAMNFTVTAQDAGNATVTGYTGTVHFSSTDGTAILPANTTLANGTGTFQATMNTAGSQTITATDTATPSITGTSSSIAVAAAACSFNISPASQSPSANGGTGSIGVTASAGSCSWTATSNNSWIAITSGGSGTGNGTVGYSVSSNTGTSPRTGTITAGGQTFTITQTGSVGTPQISVAPTTVPFGNVTEGTASDMLMLTIANIGSAALNFSIGTPDAQFSITQNTCVGTLEAGIHHCTLGIVFTPASTGPVSSSFDITSNDPANPKVTVSVNGTGMPAAGITVSLVEGWNLIGWVGDTGYYTGTAPAVSEYASGATVTQVADFGATMTAIGLTGDSYVVVGPGGQVYVPGSPFNTLTGLMPGMAYWVYIGADTDITLPGTALPAETTVTMPAGWIQAAYLGNDGTDPATGFSCISGLYDAIVNGAGEVYVPDSPFNTLDTVSQSEGYFIHATVAGTLTYSCQ